MISTETVQELKTAVDLIGIFKHYGISAQKKGNSYLALCPFHKEKEPSLSINPDKNLWNCFGCGESGDAITLIQKLGNMDFKEAVEDLAKHQNKPLKKEEKPKPRQTYSLSSQALMNRVRDFYHRVFKEKPEAKAYLESRGLTKYFEEYKIGYCDGSLLNTIPKDSELKEQLTALGILLESGPKAVPRERFINCVIFPIEDEEGNTLSFYGRHIKMKDCGHFYLPGPKQGAFNSRQLKEKKFKTIIITESIIDSYSFINNGCDNVMAIYGTNGLTASHIDLLNKLKPQDIIIALDGDEQGQKASQELEDQLKKKALFYFNSQKICFANGLDANEYFKTHTSAGSAKADFEKLLNGKVKAPTTYKLELTPTKPLIDLSRYEIKHSDNKNGKLMVTIKAINPSTKRFVLDTYNLYSQKHRQQLITAIAKLYQEPEPQIEKEVTDLIVLAEEQAKAEKAQEPEQPTAKMSEREEKEALAFLKSSNLLDQIVKDYQDIGYIGEEINKKIAYLVMTSRKMQNPLSLVIMSNSAAGKSSLQKATLEFCPEAEAKHFTRLTQQSLYYLGEDSLQHKFLSIEEEEGSSEASYSLKALLSAKQISVAATDTDQTTGKKKATEYTTKGPVAVMVSTTGSELEAEFASRTLIISIDESNNQTKNIHTQQKRRRTKTGQKKDEKREQVIQKHHHAQLMLDSELKVINDYAPQLEFPSNRLRYRRSHEQYLDLIEAVSFLKQHQKDIKSDTDLPKYIEVSKEDIAIANDIFTEVMGWTIDELKPPVRKLLNQLWDYTKTTGLIQFERRQIREELKIDQATLHRYLTKLIDLDYVRATNAPNGCKHRYELLYEGEGEAGQKFIIGLKNPEELITPENYES